MSRSTSSLPSDTKLSDYAVPHTLFKFLSISPAHQTRFRATVSTAIRTHAGPPVGAFASTLLDALRRDLRSGKMASSSSPSGSRTMSTNASDSVLDGGAVRRRLAAFSRDGVSSSKPRMETSYIPCSSRSAAIMPRSIEVTKTWRVELARGSEADVSEPGPEKSATRRKSQPAPRTEHDGIFPCCYCDLGLQGRGRERCSDWRSAENVEQDRERGHVDAVRVAVPLMLDKCRQSPARGVK